MTRRVLGLECLRLLCQPGFEVGVDALGKGHEFVVLVHGEAHQAHQVGEDAAAAFAFDLALVQSGVGLPQLPFGPQMLAAWMLASSMLHTCQRACRNSASMRASAFCSGVMSLTGGAF